MLVVVVVVVGFVAVYFAIVSAARCVPPSTNRRGQQRVDTASPPLAWAAKYKRNNKNNNDNKIAKSKTKKQANAGSLDRQQYGRQPASYNSQLYTSGRPRARKQNAHAQIRLGGTRSTARHGTAQQGTPQHSTPQQCKRKSPDKNVKTKSTPLLFNSTTTCYSQPQAVARGPLPRPSHNSIQRPPPPPPSSPSGDGCETPRGGVLDAGGHTDRKAFDSPIGLFACALLLCAIHSSSSPSSSHFQIYL